MKAYLCMIHGQHQDADTVLPFRCIVTPVTYSHPIVVRPARYDNRGMLHIIFLYCPSLETLNSLVADAKSRSFTLVCKDRPTTQVRLGLSILYSQCFCWRRVSRISFNSEIAGSESIANTARLITRLNQSHVHRGSGYSDVCHHQCPVPITQDLAFERVEGRVERKNRASTSSPLSIERFPDSCNAIKRVSQPTNSRRC